MSVADMKDHLCIRIYPLDCTIAFIQVTDKSPCLISVHLTRWPQHSLIDLVSNLYPCYIDSIILQCLKYISGMAAYSSTHLYRIISFPCGRYCLSARVSKKITVVEIDHKAHSQSLSTPCFCEDVFLVAPSIRRIDPDTKTDCIESYLLHQGNTFHFLSGRIEELTSIPFHFCDPAYICSQGKGAVFRSALHRSLRRRTSHKDGNTENQIKYSHKINVITDFADHLPDQEFLQ